MIQEHELDQADTNYRPALRTDVGQSVYSGMVRMGILTECVKPGCSHERWHDSCGLCFFHCECGGSHGRQTRRA